MTHRTRAAPALLVPAGCSKLMQSELGVCKRGKGQFRGVSHTGHWDPRPGVQPDTQYMLDFLVLKCLIIKISKVAIPTVLPDGLPRTQVFRGKGNERPRRQGVCPSAKNVGILTLPLPGCRSLGSFLIKPHILIYKRRRCFASRTVSEGLL